MAATGRTAPVQSAMADRGIVISRVISAPLDLVFEAFTEVRHLSQWWGPEGFTTVEKYHAIEGGQQTLSNLAAYVIEIVRKAVDADVSSGQRRAFAPGLRPVTSL